MVRSESRDMRTRSGGERRSYVSGMGLYGKSEQRLLIGKRLWTHANKENEDFLETDRFRLAERRDWDSARSRERKERNSDWSRSGCRVK
jgi:hypothetical protein